MFVPSMSIAPVVATAFRSICPPSTVRLVNRVTPPTAPVNVTEPVSASTVSAWPPFTVELKLILPSVVSPSSSLSTVTAPASVTAPVKVMAPSLLP